MPVSISMPPEGVASVISEATEAAPHIAHMRQEQLSEDHKPHRVFTADLKDITTERGLKRVQHIGWRVFHHEDGKVCLEVYCDASGALHEFGGINTGPFVEGTRAALREVEQLIHVGEHDLELNVLRIPELRVMALWLRHEDSTRDVIVPMAPTYHLLEPGKAYSLGEFLAALRGDGKGRLKCGPLPV